MKKYVALGLLLAWLASPSRADVRKWTDVTGKFSVEAELVAVEQGRVQLRKANGKVISLPLAKLSKSDRQFVRQHNAGGRNGDVDRADQPKQEADRRPGIQVKGEARWSSPEAMSMQGRPRPQSLEVLIDVTGEQAVNASALGKLRIGSVVDGRGRRLRPAEGLDSGEALRLFLLPIARIEEEDFGPMPDDQRKAMADAGIDPQKMMNDAAGPNGPIPRKDGVRFPVRLAPPKRPLQKIALLRGSFQLQTGGKREVVMIDDVGSLVGKTVDDETLKSAGLTLQIGKPNPLTISVAVRGDYGVIHRMWVTNTGNERPNWGSGMSNINGRVQYFFTFPDKVPDEIQLKVILLLAEKVITVPFELKDLQVPQPAR